MVKKLFTYFGNKQRIAKQVWELFGETDAYVEPFCGCAAVLLHSPYSHRYEAINDFDCYIVNAHRAVKYFPEQVKEHLYNPRFEADLHARHDYLVSHKMRFAADMMRGDPKFCDPELAAWWIWGINLWIGGNWCSEEHCVKGIRCKTVAGSQGVLTKLYDDGVEKLRAKNGNSKPIASNQGVLTMSRKPVARNKGVLNKGNRVEIIDSMVSDVFERLVDVNILYGDFARVLTPSYTTAFGTCAVFLDPPYDGNGVYCEKVQTNTTWERARDWFVDNMHNKDLRIILCGEEKQWSDYPKSIRVHKWDRSSGYAIDKSKRTEMIWISDGCIKCKEDKKSKKKTEIFNLFK